MFPLQIRGKAIGTNIEVFAVKTVIPDVLYGITTALVTGMLVEQKLIFLRVCLVLFFAIFKDAGLELPLLNCGLCIRHVLIGLNLDHLA